MKKAFLMFSLALGISTAILTSAFAAAASHKCPFTCEKSDRNACCVGTDADGTAWSIRGVHRVE